MKKAGILTFQFAHNYGAQLQAYALKTRMEGLGFDTSVINYLPKGTWEAYSLNPWYCIRKKQLRKLFTIPKRVNQVREFHSFQKKYLGLGAPVAQMDDTAVAGYDALIVGSDQVWSDSILQDVSPYFFRDIHGKVKLSYAGSFGSNHLSDGVSDLVRSELPEFSAVSVREEKAAALIQNIVPEVAAVPVCDPVFLLDAEHWRRLYRTCNYEVPEGKFVLYVDLRNDPKLAEKALELGKEKNLPVYYIHPTCWETTVPEIHQLYDVGPLQYLALMDAAEYVVTNSFHAMAFSCIFSCKTLHYAEGGLGDRVRDLLGTLGVTSQDEIVDFSQYQAAKAEYVLRGENFLNMVKKLITRQNDYDM